MPVRKYTEFISEDALYEQLREKLGIDRRKIVEQLEQNAEIFDVVGSMVAKLWDQAEFYAIECDVMESRTSSRIRAEWEKDGVKITEKAITDKTEQDEEYLSMRHLKRQAKAEHQKWSSLLQAFDKRAYALESVSRAVQSNLVQYGR